TGSSGPSSSTPQPFPSPPVRRRSAIEESAMSTWSRRTASLAAILVIGTALGGCNTLTRLSQVGEEPPLTNIQNPTALPTYQPVSMPMPAPITEERQANSLWRTGSRAFFKDQRASQV